MLLISFSKMCYLSHDRSPSDLITPSVSPGTPHVGCLRFPLLSVDRSIPSEVRQTVHDKTCCMRHLIAHGLFPVGRIAGQWYADPCSLSSSDGLG